MISEPPLRYEHSFKRSNIVCCYAAAAQPLIHETFGYGCCITATRITLEVMKAFGISALPVAVTLQAGLPDMNLGINYGFKLEQLVEMGVGLLPQTFDDRGWMGHLVAVVPNVDGQSLLLDASFDQVVIGLNQKSANIRRTPQVELLELPPGGLKKCCLFRSETECGRPLVAQYHATKDKSYRREPSWQFGSKELLTAKIISESILKMLGRNAHA